jgi:hypothetical protein
MGSRKLVIGLGVVVVLVVGLVVVGIAVFSSGDDNKPKSANKGATKSGAKTSSGKSGSGNSSGGSSGAALHTVVVKRADGKIATANAGSLVQKPDQIWIRVSAAPKQPVRVTWLLACGGKQSVQDNYVVTPPHLRELPVPKKVQTCATSVAGQLVDGSGRLKVAILRNG